MMSSKSEVSGIYVVTDEALAASVSLTVAQIAEQAVAAGAGVVQVRCKSADARPFLGQVRAVCKAVPGATIIVNDRVDVFLAARAAGLPVAGVHVGQNDLPADTVRTMVGAQAIVGVSCRTHDELCAAHDSGADYAGVGPVYTTTTKHDAPLALGIERLAELIGGSPLPVVGIGGIDAGHVRDVRATGAVGAAVVSAVCARQDPFTATEQLVSRWQDTVPR